MAHYVERAAARPIVSILVEISVMSEARFTRSSSPGDYGPHAE
ncbi:hypothetical protein OG788_04180 [Streptomyces sp. NBC_00647]